MGVAHVEDRVGDLGGERQQGQRLSGQENGPTAVGEEPARDQPG